MSGDSAFNKALVVVSFFANALYLVLELKKRLKIHFIDILIANVFFEKILEKIFGN